MSTRNKSADKTSEFEAFIEQTADYLPPSKTKHDLTQDSKQSSKHSNKHSNKQSSKHINKQVSTLTSTRKKKVSIGDLFAEPVAKEKMVNTTLQLPESLNGRLKTFCADFGKSKNEVIRTLVEALLDEKGF